MLGERLADRTTGCYQDPGFTVAQKEKCANIIYQPSNTSVLGTHITHMIFAISSYFLLSFFLQGLQEVHKRLRYLIIRT